MGMIISVFQVRKRKVLKTENYYPTHHNIQVSVDACLVFEDMLVYRYA